MVSSADVSVSRGDSVALYSSQPLAVPLIMKVAEAYVVLPSCEASATLTHCCFTASGLASRSCCKVSMPDHIAGLHIKRPSTASGLAPSSAPQRTLHCFTCIAGCAKLCNAAVPLAMGTRAVLPPASYLGKWHLRGLPVRLRGTETAHTAAQLAQECPSSPRC